MMEHLAPIRSMTTKEGDHTRATYYLRTGYLPVGPLQYPSMGSFLGKALRRDDCDLPAYISISPFRAFSPGAFSPGFLGPAWSPLVVGAQTTNDAISFEVQNLKVTSRSDRISGGGTPADVEWFGALIPDIAPRQSRRKAIFSPTSRQSR